MLSTNSYQFHSKKQHGVWNIFETPASSNVRNSCQGEALPKVHGFFPQSQQLKEVSFSKSLSWTHPPECLNVHSLITWIRFTELQVHPYHSAWSIWNISCHMQMWAIGNGCPIFLTIAEIDIQVVYIFKESNSFAFEKWFWKTNGTTCGEPSPFQGVNCLWSMLKPLVFHAGTTLSTLLRRSRLSSWDALVTFNWLHVGQVSSR